MDYTAWVEEYESNAKSISKIIKSLEQERKDSKDVRKKQNLTAEIGNYRYIYNDFIKTANKLKRRARCKECNFC